MIVRAFMNSISLKGKKHCFIVGEMGSLTGIRLALDAAEAAEPIESGKVYVSELNGLFVFPPDQVIPFYREGQIICHARIDSYTKYANGRTVVCYESSELATLKEIPLEFNWLIKLHDEGSLESCLHENAVLEFDKPKDPIYRDFPVGIPMGLWRYPLPSKEFGAVALAKVKIQEVTVGHGTSKGLYEVIKVFSKPEQDLLSRNFL